MVDRKPKKLQWEVSHSGQASDSNTDRRLTGRLGSQLHGYGDWGEMVSRREETAYKYPRTPSVEECHLSFYKRENNASHTQTDNTTALSYPLNLRGTTDIWQYLILKQIIITAKYLSGTLYTRAD